MPKVGEVLLHKSIFSFEKVAEGNLGQVLRWSCQVQFSLFSRQETFLFIFSSSASFHFIKTSMSLIVLLYVQDWFPNQLSWNATKFRVLSQRRAVWRLLSSLQRKTASFPFCENWGESLEKTLILLNLIMIVVQCTAVMYNKLEWSVHTERGWGSGFQIKSAAGGSWLLELVHSVLCC